MIIISWKWVATTAWPVLRLPVIPLSSYMVVKGFDPRVPYHKETGR